MATNLLRFIRKGVISKAKCNQRYFNAIYQNSDQEYNEKTSFTKKVPSGDYIERSICDHCGVILYSNPKIATGIIAVYNKNEILLTKRDIEPRKGYWCLPGGFLESHESPQDGAIREALEEVNAKIILGSLLSVYSVPSVDQIMMYFRAILPEQDGFSAGVECQEAKLFKYDDIPWDKIAFPANERGLRFWHSNHDNDAVDVHTFRNYNC